MTSVYIETHGCTLNQSEAEEITNQLEGHKFVEHADDAEVLILNACVVIETTEKRILKRITALCDDLDNRQLVVTGCMTESLRDRLHVLCPRLVFVPSGLVASHINSRFKCETTSQRQCGITTRVKIAEGCHGSCSYCIVRLVRGKIKSRRLEDVVRDVDRSVQRGAKQILLAAQDAGAYGLDVGYRLPDLIGAICALEYDFKLRIGMMNIASIQDAFEELLTAFECAKVYKFLHVPVQSGSDRILSLMDRGHTVSDFVRCVSKFRQKYKHGTISTDFIVGFPTETDADFQLTRQLLRDTKPLKVNITRFSPREGTTAVSLGPVTPRIVKDRSRILTAEHHRVAHEQNRKCIGKKCTALAVEKGKNRSTILYNDSYRPIVVPSVLPLGTNHAVKVIEATRTYLLGILD